MVLSKNHFPKPVIFGVVLLLSLAGNVLQFALAREDASTVQLGRNLVKTELIAMANTIGDGVACETMGALRITLGTTKALTCNQVMKWEPARCNDKGQLARDDQGVILVCDGDLWAAS